ncbi:hrpB [Symbiodinium sp. CCMP2592]|nr:hrpB [Symbiodinium sp. CCMP2592]
MGSIGHPKDVAVDHPRNTARPVVRTRAASNQAAAGVGSSAATLSPPDVLEIRSAGSPWLSKSKGLESRRWTWTLCTSAAATPARVGAGEADLTLPKVAAVLFDEFHERSLGNDLALALCLHARDARRRADLPPLRLLAMSATLSPRLAESLAQRLGSSEPAPILRSEGKQPASEGSG